MTNKKLNLDKFLTPDPASESDKTIGQKAQEEFFSQKFNDFLNSATKDEPVRTFSINFTKSQKDIIDDATYVLRKTRKEIILKAIALYLRDQGIL